MLLDDNDAVSTGSRGICWAKRTLEIFDRLGVAAPMVAEGVTWQVGRTYHRDREVFAFDLLPEDGHKQPAFINLPQCRVEEFLLDRIRATPAIDLRFGNRVDRARAPRTDHVALDDRDADRPLSARGRLRGRLRRRALADARHARPRLRGRALRGAAS